MADPERVAELFDAALDVAPEDLEAFLATACGADAELKRRVMALVRADRGASAKFLVTAGGAEKLVQRIGELTPGTIFHGRYEIKREIGRGGMGVVYAARDIKTRRTRALKVMLPSLVSDEDLRQRFAREATVAGEIESDHIADVIDAGVDDATGMPFITLELLKGTVVAQLISERGPMAAAEAAVYVQQTALALRKAHAAGIVHRDLKPENLFVTYRDDGKPSVKVLDFGLAKIVAASTLRDARTRGMLGTPLYMAPEQVDCTRITTRADIYALGQVTYTLLVGEPFWTPEAERSDDVVQLLTTLVRGQPEPACQRALGRARVRIPGGFDVWFARSTAVNPDNRFEDIDKQIEVLKRALGVTGLAVSQWPPPPAAPQPMRTPLDAPPPQLGPMGTLRILDEPDSK